jgi:protein-arginine kinase activator protein McsA
LASLEEQGPEAAISELNAGLTTFRDLFARYDASEQFENDELVKRLSEMRESVRQRYEIGRTLPEQLDDAVKAEDYELAAKIRDRIRNGEKVSADGTGDGADAVEH